MNGIRRAARPHCGLDLQVILIDSNILIHAHNADSPHHSIARDWLDEKLNGAAAVGLPWMSLLAFLRIATNPRAFVNPASIVEAWSQVDEWLTCESVWTPQPTERHSAILGELLTQGHVQGNFVMDAHLAALAIEHGPTLCSADSDFAKFPKLHWLNPLMPTDSK
jgi:toxin-antitoxin system PIN domain toxin